MKLLTCLQIIRLFAFEGKIRPIYLGIFITCFALWAQLNSTTVIASIIDRLSFLINDQRLSIMPKHVKPPYNKIVIIDLDERSLQAEGQYPWNLIRVIFKA